MADREILYRFGADLSPLRSAFREIQSLFDSLSGKQQDDREAEAKALGKYSDSVKQLVDQFGSLSEEITKQIGSAQEIANSYRQVVTDARTRLDHEIQITREVERQRDAMLGAGTGARPTPAPGSRAPGLAGTRSPGTTMAPEWQTATTKLRADVAQESISTAQVATERARIVGLIDQEIAALKSKSELTTKERSSLQALTLERERQTDAQRTRHKIGVTAGTQEALLQGAGNIGTAAIGGGELGTLGAGIIGGFIGGGLVGAIQAASQALADFVGEIRNLVTESDKLANVQNTFEQLSHGIGAAPTQFIDQLRVATRGLVSDTQLMESANRVMLQGIGLTGPQIQKLIGTFSTLALVQGKDATESFDYMTRALSSGRLSMLAFNTGLDRMSQLQLKASESIPLNERAQAQFNIAMEGAQRQIDKIGAPIDNLGTGLKRASVAWTDFIEKLSLSVSQSDGANKLSDAFGNLIDSFTKDPSVMDGIVDTFSAMAAAIGDTANAVERLHKFWQDTSSPESIKAAGGIGGVFSGLGTFLEGGHGIPGASTPNTTWSRTIAPAGSATLAGLIRSAFGEKPPAVPGMPASIFARAESAANLGAGISAGQAALASTAPSAPPPYDVEEEKKKAEELSKIRLQHIQQDYDATKFGLDAEAELYKQSYAAGTIQLQDYLNKQAQLKIDQAEADKTRTTEETKARLAALQIDMAHLIRPVAQGGLGQPKSGEAYQSDVRQQTAAEQEGATKRKEIDQKLQLELLAIYAQGQDDEIAATKTRIQADYDITKAGYDRQSQILEEKFKQDLIDGQDYLDHKKLLIVEEYNAVVANEQAKLNAAGHGDAAEAQFNEATQKAAIDRDRELLAIDLSSYETRSKAAEDYYKSVQGLLESQLTIAKARTAGTGITSTEQVELTREIVASLQEENTELARQAQEALAAGQLQTYRQIETQINNNTAAVIKYNQELARSRDILSPMGGFFSDIGKALSVLSFPSGQRAAQGLSGIGSFFSTIGGINTQVSEQQAAAAGVPVFAEGGPVGQSGLSHLTAGEFVVPNIDAVLNSILPKVSTTGLDALAPAAKAATDALMKMAEAAAAAAAGPAGSSPAAPITGALGTLPMTRAGGFGQMPTPATINANPIMAVIDGFKALPEVLKGSKEGLAKFTGGIQDAVGMVSEWAQVASGKQGVVGGAISGAGAGLSAGKDITGALGITGPVGAAIGGGMALLGGLIGIFSAKALAETQKLATTITDSFNNVMASLQIGTTGLNSAIQQTEALRAQAIAQLTGAKGGQQELNQILPQFNQQIAQLQAQQAQILATFDQTSQILTAPQPFQQYLQGMQSIIQSYQQYVAAGGSVAEANQNLANSFANLRVADTQQFLSDEQSAIQNAINYNDLLVQQQELVINTNQQIENVMAAGSVTRQAPTAMTKGLQIAQIQIQYQLQEQNLTAQISAAQYQYKAQQAMLGLATTRVGLELQLVAVQDAQTNQSLLQVGALQSVLGMLSGATAAGGNTLQAIGAALQGGTSTSAALLGGMSVILNALGINTGQITGAQLNALLAAMLAAIPGLNAPGVLSGLFGQPVTQNAQNAGAGSAIPSFQEGGVMETTGMAFLHANEVITPASDAAAQASATANRVVAETQILSAAQLRLNVETQIYNLKVQEMNMLAALVQAGGGSADSAGLLAVYQNRGRQGLGGFYGELG